MKRLRSKPNDSVASVFMMPKAVKITGRTSSITNSFVNGIIPRFHPTEDEVAEALRILGLDPADLRCAYCGDKCSEWDHFRPIVTGKRPTGYVSEIANLVPACGKCNQSKGARHWHDWITGSARHSPARRGIVDLEDRIRRLVDFEAWRQPRIFDFEAAVGTDLWKQYWEDNQRLLTLMAECEVRAGEIRIAMQRSSMPA